MDGYGLKRALAAQPETAGIPVILLTSKASPEEEQKALSSGFYDFIAKPVNAVRIVSRIRRAIEVTERRNS
jgi:response regulator RpfG family c-di-GMP phosphodiesterase